MTKVLAVRTFNRPNNRLYAKVIKSLLLQLFGPPEEIVESQHSYCPNGDKTWCKYHKDKIFNRNIYDRLKCLPFVFRSELHANVGSLKNQNESINNMIWSKCPKRVYVAKADLLFLYVNEMK